MEILIVAKTEQDFDDCRATYSPESQSANTFHHVTKREDLFGHKMPLQIRFYENWYELPEAEGISWTADIITRQPRTEQSVRVK